MTKVDVIERILRPFMVFFDKIGIPGIFFPVVVVWAYLVFRFIQDFAQKRSLSWRYFLAIACAIFMLVMAVMSLNE